MIEQVTLKQALDLITEQQAHIMVANDKLINTIINDQHNQIINIIEQDERIQADNMLENLDDIIE